jgi:hypothetical protein
MAGRARSASFCVRWWRLVAAGAVALSVAVFCCQSAGSSLEAARMARTERLAMTAHLRYVTARGSYLLEEGSAVGPLAGAVKARIRFTADISGSFAFYPRGGSITGYGSGKLHESGTYVSFGGTVTITGGTGRFAHARGSGGLYGVYDRRTLGLTIQTTGDVSY